MKSRLTMRLLVCRGHSGGPIKTKRGGHPRRGAADQFRGSIARSVDRVNPRPSGAAPRQRRPAATPAGPYPTGTAARLTESGRATSRVSRVPSVDVVLEDLEELGDDAVAAQRPIEPAVHVDRRLRLLERARQRDADVGVLRLARAVHDAAHDRDLHLLDAGVALAPHRHLLAQVVLDLLGHLLEEGAGGAAAAGAAGHLRREAAQAERLEDLLRDLDLLGAVAARRRASARRGSCRRCPPGAGSRAPRCVATMPLAPMPASVRPRCSG